MAIIIHKLKTLNTKKAFASVLLAGMAAFVISFVPAAAQGPQFNIFPISYTGELNRDLPMLDARNVSRSENWSTSQSDHDAGVQASPGEIIEFSVYYHNGAADADENVALNAFVKAIASPSLAGSNTTHRISAQVGAQNASTVSSSDSFHGGDMNVHIANSQSLPLSLVPGSVYLFKDRGLTPVPAPLQLPDSIFTSQVNIGNVRGCFQYHGFVNFRLQVGQALPSSLSMVKTVRKVTDSGAFADQVNADPNETVEFKLVGTNTGQTPLTDIRFKDVLPSRLSYIPGTLQSTLGTIGGDLFSGSGLDTADLAVGVSNTITFRAQVALASQFNIGTTELVNSGSVENAGANPVAPVSDTARVVVTIQPQVVSCTFAWNSPNLTDGRGSRRVGDLFNVSEQVTGLSANSSFNIAHQHVSGSPIFRYARTASNSGSYSNFNSGTIPSTYTTGDYNAFIEVAGVNVAVCRGFRVEPAVVSQIDLDKTVGGTSFSDQIDIQPGQRVTFRLVVSPLSSNSALENVVVRDSLPSNGKLIYATGSFNLNGTNISEGAFFSSGLNVGAIQPSSQVVITFQADVASGANFTTGTCEILTNTGTVNSASLSDSDTANVRVCKQAAQKQSGSPGVRPQ